MLACRKLDKVARRRVLTYVLVGLALVVSCLLLPNWQWQGNADLHTLMEALAAFLAFIVGSMALVRFYSKKDNTFLIIGTGFLGTAFLDTYHAVVTSVWIENYLPSNVASLIPWSWSTSRLYLSAGFFLSCLAWRREQQLGHAGHLNERAIYVITASLTLSIFLFFAIVPLPRAYYPEYLFHRPEELLPALLFLLALVCYFRKGHWQSNALENWLVLSLILGVASQALVMPFSAQLFDIQFDTAHLLKLASYLCVLIGLFLNMATTFRQAEIRAVALAKSKVTLTHEVAARTAQLKESEARFKQAAHIARLGHYSFDDTSQQYLTVSEEYARIFGYTADEFMKRYRTLERDMYLVHADDRAMVEKEYQGNGTINFEYRIVRADGSIRNVFETAEPVLDDTGRTTRYYGTLQDITELRKVERELRAAKETAEEANRAKSAFLSNMSHDLQTPLNAIIGYSDMMQDEVKELLPDSSSLHADLQTISKAGKHLSALIKDVLALSKISAGDMTASAENFGVEDLVKDVSSSIEPTATQRGNALELICPVGIGHMNSDSDKIREVLRQLLGNAAKFTESGRIQIEVRREGRGSDDFIEFQVRDDGIGMSAEQASEVFDPFVQVKNSTASGQLGTGLGLAISRELCRTLGGDISVESELGKGSKFTVVLPADIAGQTA